MKTVRVLGVQVACVDRQEMLGAVQRWVEEGLSNPEGLPRVLSYVNAHCLNLACRDAVYRALLNRVDLLYADGVGAVWAARMHGSCRLHKLTGADWFDDFCRLAQAQGWGVYILAGRPGVAQRARVRMRERYPRLRVLGAQDGFFAESHPEQVFARLREAKPEVLFVGMGAPQQEKWIFAHREQLPVKICWAVGALFDYVAGVEPRAPLWMRRLALEWFWRLLLDPRGKWRRYLLGNPRFVLRVLRDRWR